MTRQMTDEQREHRRQVQHERYMRKREEILAKQKVYRDTHKAEIAAKRRQRDFEKKYLQIEYLYLYLEQPHINHKYYIHYLDL